MELNDSRKLSTVQGVKLAFLMDSKYWAVLLATLFPLVIAMRCGRTRGISCSLVTRVYLLLVLTSVVSYWTFLDLFQKLAVLLGNI